jgi:ice-binding like protein
MNDPFRRTALAVSVCIGLILAIGTVSSTANAAGPTTVGLGTAGSFAVLAGTPAITNTGATTVTGDVGIHPAAAVTGFPPGIVNGTIHAADAIALQAKSDLVNAYVDAAGRPATATHATLGGLTLPGGTYNSGGATLGLTGTLTLDGQSVPSSVWIFQATSDLVTASASSVTFINGAQPCNVFWQVTSSATLGSGSFFAGTILALTDITMASGVTLSGRALARDGAVTLINDTLVTSSCASAQAALPTCPPDLVGLATGCTRGPTPAPVSTATPTTTTPPTATPSASSSAVGVATATPGSAATPSTATATPAAATPLIAGLPATSTDDETLPYLILPILLIIFLVLYLVARARRRRASPITPVI